MGPTPAFFVGRKRAATPGSAVLSRTNRQTDGIDDDGLSDTQESRFPLRWPTTIEEDNETMANANIDGELAVEIADVDGGDSDEGSESET